MSEIVCLLSELSGKVFRAKKGEEDLKRGDFCIVESELGGDLVVVVDASKEVCSHQKSVQNAVKIIRKATEEDKRKFKWLRKKEKKAFDFCVKRINSRNLPMKLIQVRYFFNEKKGIFYYTADGRIDFRQLVKDLAKEFKMRIEMRQIGVRDEAKMVGGLGVCGRPLCCLSFMKNFEPVTIQTAKNSKL